VNDNTAESAGARSARASGVVDEGALIDIKTKIAVAVRQGEGAFRIVPIGLSPDTKHGRDNALEKLGLVVVPIRTTTVGPGRCTIPGEGRGFIAMTRLSTGRTVCLAGLWVVVRTSQGVPDGVDAPVEYHQVAEPLLSTSSTCLHRELVLGLPR
jgi:hypothetical protein